MITIDFETRGIAGNPIVYPPQAVGMAVLVDGHAPVYLGWGHGGKNNCTYQEAKNYYDRLIASGEPLLYHNGWSFDIPVELRWMGLREPHDWKRVHDTLYMLYLMDPYADTLSLKPSAERYLNLPPDSQDNLRQTVLRNAGRDLGKDWMGYAWRYTSAYEMEEYAIDDVLKTRALYEHLKDKVPSEPYDREREIAPILHRATVNGIRIDRQRLDSDLNRYEEVLEQCNSMLRARLDSDIDELKGDALADALERAGLVDEWVVTPTGKRSTSKENLLSAINDKSVVDLLVYRSSIQTCLQTFMRPWLTKSTEDGRVHPNWNAVRSTENNRRKGTRTGRLSSDDPNFQNVPTEFNIVVPDGFPEPPYMRIYCLPEEGHVWAKRDFSSQEFRIMAHFEDGTLCEAYRADPMLDPHSMGRGFILEATGIDYPRKDVKITGFSIIYGSGVPGLSSQLGRPPHEAAHIRAAYFQAFPGAKQLISDVQAVGRSGSPITTWGGRKYYVEPPKLVQGRMRTFEYKLLNYLIQGSAADQTKQTIIDWDKERDLSTVFLATVHDEINISVPEGIVKPEMVTLRRCMHRDYFDVPMRSEGFVGPNWHEIKEVE